MGRFAPLAYCAAALASLYVQSASAVEVTEPASWPVIESSEFTLTYTEASNANGCNSGYIFIYDAEGNELLSQSLASSDGFVTTQLAGLPETGEQLYFNLRCRNRYWHNEYATAYLYVAPEPDPEPEPDPDPDPDTESEITVNVVLDSTELQQVFSTVLTDFDSDLFTFILGGVFTSLSIGLGGGWLYKAIKSR